jgi:hypothetical protein
MMFRCFYNFEKSGAGKISAFRDVDDIQIGQRRKKYQQALTVDLSA